jgi:peptidoglycan/LPS O-acetylase OafA/YrhL
MHGGRLTELDGLRALAIGAVLAFHCVRFPLAGHSLASYAGRIASGGWGGVDIFFALSGFLVGGILIDGRGQAGLTRSFLIRRFMRIVPLYAVVLASFYFVPTLVTSAVARDWLFGGAAPWWSYTTLTQNFAVPLIGHDAFYLGPTWSLAVEVQIYLLLSFLLTRLPTQAVLPTMIVGIAVAEICRLIATTSGHGIFGYFTVPARIDGACLGVLAALIIRSDVALAKARRWSRLIWIIAAGLITGAGILSAIGQGVGSLGANLYTHLALALASSAMITALVATPEGWQNAVLRSRPMVALGTISYGVYLIHIPVIGLTHVILGRSSFVIDGWSGAVATVVGMLATICLALLSWRYFETPLIRWSHRLSAAPVKQVSSPATATIATTI